MPNHQIDVLFQLIKSLTKAEKRNFKLYATRNQSGIDLKFVQLFDVLDKQKAFDEDLVFKKLPQLKKQQFSNLKRHLYKQILASLRLIHAQKNIDIELREQLDYMRILYNKGLFLQSLKLLDRAKQIAKDNHQDILHLEILEFEKMIESRHITRSIGNRAAVLSAESNIRMKAIQGVSHLTNLGLQLYSMYIKIGHVRSAKDVLMIQELFEQKLKEEAAKKRTFFEKVYLCQAYVWYYYILQDFAHCYKYAQKWVDLFKQNPQMIKRDLDLYMRGYNNLLSTLYLSAYASKLRFYLEELEAFIAKKESVFSENSRIIAFLYLNMARFNQYFLEGRFTDGLAWVGDLEQELLQMEAQKEIDSHRILVFYYKIGSLYFSSGNNARAIDFLNKIVQSNVGNLREDIQCYARMLLLIAHYELGNYDLLEYLVKSVYRFLRKMEDLNEVQKEVLLFLRKALYCNPNELLPLFEKLRLSLLKWVDHPYEKRSFLYLDIISWLESKIENRPVEEVIRAKYLETKR